MGISIDGLRKVFRQTSTGQEIVAIDRLDLAIAPRELIAIVGQTGCGKSTLFDLLIGLSKRRPTATIRIGGKAPFGDFDYFRGRIATVFQQDRLLPWRSALDNVRLPLELLGVPEAEQRARALDWLKRLGLERFATAYPRELSGGMRQRVAIARAFVVQPAILLADEAFGHLDEVTAAELRDEVRDAGARERLDRDPDHASARRGDRGRRPHRGVRKIGVTAGGYPRRRLESCGLSVAARGDPGLVAAERAGWTVEARIVAWIECRASGTKSGDGICGSLRSRISLRSIRATESKQDVDGPHEAGHDER